MNKIVFEEPPMRPRVGSQEKQDILAELKSRSGEWARVRESKDRQAMYAAASRIRTGRDVWAKGCEAMAVPYNGGYALYLRWPRQAGGER